jgi:hypothetical protein
MTTRRAFMAMIVACACVGYALAEPEPTPRETKGQITGEITMKDGAKITVKGADAFLTLMPHWRGGMPADGGGFDKEMVKRLEHFKVGDKVTVSWVFDEHYRIEAIERVGRSG